MSGHPPEAPEPSKPISDEKLAAIADRWLLMPVGSIGHDDIAALLAEVYRLRRKVTSHEKA